MWTQNLLQWINILYTSTTQVMDTKLYAPSVLTSSIFIGAAILCRLNVASAGGMCGTVLMFIVQVIVDLCQEGDYQTGENCFLLIYYHHLELGTYFTMKGILKWPRFGSWEYSLCQMKQIVSNVLRILWVESKKERKMGQNKMYVITLKIFFFSLTFNFLYLNKGKRGTDPWQPRRRVLSR